VILREILEGVRYKEIYGDPDIAVKDICIDSRKAVKGGLFAAVKGFKLDGHDFARDAVINGAASLIVNRKLDVDPAITQVVVDDTRKVLPAVSDNFFMHPSKNLKVIGITGTNGKTTTCYLIDSILRAAGIKTSMITTYRSYIDGTEVKFDRTTPESVDLHRFFTAGRDRDVEFACMEVSSHSIDLHRVDYIDFDYIIFTNLTQDHLDYHGSIEKYFEVKSRLFDTGNHKCYGEGKAVINIDDSFGLRLFNGTDREKISYGIKDKKADVRAEDIQSSIAGIRMDIISGNDSTFINTPLCGIFNIYNILAAFSVCLEAGISREHIADGIGRMKGFGGRFEKIEDDSGRTVIVDYAHTPDGLQNVLQTAREILAENGRLISVFGCGGDRDIGKREKMGAISAELADYSIITSDNPRCEDPDKIIDMVEKGFQGNIAGEYIRITDRKEAIFKAMDMAGRGDLVLIAGKGHEDYQEFEDGRRIPFSDPGVVREYNENKRKDKNK